MKIYNRIEKCDNKTAVALGFFDGVHLAHRQVILKAAAQKNEQTLSAVLTFSFDNKTPDNKFNIKTILTKRQKYEQIERLYIDEVFDIDFAKVADMPPEIFFNEVLVKKLNVSFISCGYDYTFGKNASGDITLLKKLCDRNSIELSVLDKLSDGDMTVSSSAIRTALLDGDIELANRLLGYSYYIEEEIIHGRHLGNTIGFPTINQRLSHERVIPKYGVYFSTTAVDGKKYKSITNVGVKPTVGKEKEPLAETYIIGFDGDIYGKEVSVYFHKMQRPEVKFSGIDELKNAINKSVESRILYTDY